MLTAHLSYCMLFALWLLSPLLFGQEIEVEEEREGRHRIAIVMGHAHVPEGIDNMGEKKWLVLPSWGLDYDYRLNARWAIGFHSDIIIENFELEEQFGEEKAIIERSRPLASTAVVSFKPGKHLTLVLGAGGEFAKEENFALIRAELDYGWELPHAWELGVSLMNDFKINAYNSWVLGLGVSKFLE